MAPGVGNVAVEMTVRGQQVLQWPYPSVDEFKAKPRLSGIPFMGPWANRLDEQAFYANGRRFPFDMELGNVRGQIPIHGFLSYTDQWKVLEAKADASSAWVTSRLEFYRHPLWMKQFPFAHAIEMTYRLQGGLLEVRTRIENLLSEPMPVSVGFHPYFQLTDSTRDDWTISVGARTHWVLAQPTKLPTGETQPITHVFADPAAAPLKDHDLDHVFGDLVRDSSGGARHDGQGQIAAARRDRRSQLSRDGDLRAEAAAGPAQRPELHLLRTDGGNHQCDEPGAQRALQGAAKHPARRRLAGKLLGPPERILRKHLCEKSPTA